MANGRANGRATGRAGRTGGGRPMAPSLRYWQGGGEIPPEMRPASNVSVDCGWGRLIFAHTYDSPEVLAEELGKEARGKRDVAFYARDPHVAVAGAPQNVFLDPSHAYRLWLDQYRAPRHRGFVVRRARPSRDAAQINRIYRKWQMVPVQKSFLESTTTSKTITVLVAENTESEKIAGVVFGVDHVHAMNDPENGSSLWALAVDPDTQLAGVGEGLTRHLAGHFATRGRAYMDLSVLHKNREAIALYKKIGFQRVPIFTLKAKNSINEPLFIGPEQDDGLNPYAALIVNEARKRGIAVKVLDAARGYFRLTCGGQSIVCRESLSELTSAIAMSRCDDKALTRAVLTEAGLRMPEQMLLGAGENPDELIDLFQRKVGRAVVKPVRGEQGTGVSVDLGTREEMLVAVENARRECDSVLLEQFVEGVDLRILVIGGEVVAAAVRKPAEILGNGKDTARRLIEKQSRRREAATGGESRVPLDRETERCLAEAGYGYDDVPPRGKTLRVRRGANLHTGGTIHDVTDTLNPVLAEAAIDAAKALQIPVVGMDLITPDPAGEDYVIIEANERPGLANHEPRPTAEKFIDLLFPQTAAAG